ncbi:hypothetical protein [Rhodococcus rhodochrous]|uniref:hypothetical protein n=1 Tax=Rhodococcus rhodochrous TaxID=1829 RepID=UPI0017855F86|nr:hypothetical protein [Rhodococcus rhodochrous]QOH59908.1 hypothetical protein C6Y44_27860 [Rhodococcus rhodochrous]
MRSTPETRSVATNLGENITVDHAVIDDIPFVTIHARMAEGLADLSPAAARDLGRILISSADAAEGIRDVVAERDSTPSVLAS